MRENVYIVFVYIKEILIQFDHLPEWQFSLSEE